MFDVDGLELWEQDGYAEAMYEQADNARKAERENPAADLSPLTNSPPGQRDLHNPQMRAPDGEINRNTGGT